MKKCKYCKTEIDSKAKICPSCRKSQANPVLRGIMIALGVMIVIGGISALGNDLSGEEKNISKYITLEEFNKIETGMTYDQVKEIIGSEGTVNSDTSYGGQRMIIYSWYGSDEISNANFNFENDSLINKTQIGLK